MNQEARSRVRSTALAVLAFFALAFGVSRLQPRLASQLHGIKDLDDVYPFPPPPVLRVATLGYVAATVDVLWGKLLVENGTHWTEHRPFADLEHYLDAVIGLDPTFHPFYEYVDSLLCYRPMNGHEPDAREARAYLERGTRELPNDAQVWLKYGQFIAFMGPSYLSSEAERQAWRRDGAIAITHAVDLGADLQYGVAASSMLDSRLGERQASIDFLMRAYALATAAGDEARQAEIAAQLARRRAGEVIDQTRDALETIRSRWRQDYPFLDYGTFLLVGPVPDRLRCVGAATSGDPDCSHDWDDALRR
jgi:hypothetical protein